VKSNENTQGNIRKPTSVKYVTGVRCLENIPEVQVCDRVS